jgi:hypothetical protein
MLEAAGLFLGHRKEGNNESLFFLNIDKWLISQSGASWENPAPIRYLLENRQIRAMTADYMQRYLLDSPRVISFLGCFFFGLEEVFATPDTFQHARALGMEMSLDDLHASFMAGRFS